ncbi:Nephrin like [Heracleum sosnowskyi]|uniref:Nephrin like n=1 Tax=Heracleum sosnowskyi TaxID=360622 RepID=A0AAD8J2B2_9APIA|nr:Nephrin like [Heracleum sosnowskyi]
MPCLFSEVSYKKLNVSKRKSWKMVLRKRLWLLVFLVIVSAILLSTSYAGRRFPKYVSIEKKKSVDARINDLTRINIHKRLLTVHTNDYGTYDPAPTFHKPNFKPIQN